MSDPRFILAGAGKRYRLYTRQRHKILDLLGLPGGSGPGRSRDVWALRDATFVIRPGERVGLVGRNGAGKTTLLRLLAGLVPPTEGRVERAGRARAVLELGAGFLPDFTGRENARALFALRGHGGVTRERLVEEAAAFAGLGDFLDAPARTYSAGMLARLALAVETADRPDALLLDEAFGVGDLAFLARSRERILALTAGGGVLVLASHDPALVGRFCDRALWLEGGRVVADGPPLEVTRRYEAFLRELGSADLLPAREGAAGRLLGADRVYGSGEAEITAVRLLDEAGAPAVRLPAGRAAALAVDLAGPCGGLTLAVSVYDTTGAAVAMLHSPIPAEGARRLTARFRPLLLGPGDYLASIGLYRDFSLGTPGEAAPVCVLDRALAFAVDPEPGVARDRGRFLHPCEWSVA